ncbi:hypothetical protein ILUMI_18032, partial [Ignelater luminosus]
MEDIDSDTELSIFNFESVYDNKIESILVKVRINQKELETEVDSGAAISVIPIAVFDENFSDVLRYFVADVEHNNKCRNLKLYVVSSGSTALLGRDRLAAFGLGFVNLVDNKQVRNVMQVGTESLYKLIEDYAELFKDELGTCNHTVVKLNLKPNSSQIFCKPRPIPLAYRVLVEKSLDLPDMLRELHNGHQGIVKMKALARSIMWWPGIDNDTESMGKSCVACLRNRHDPPKLSNPQWPTSQSPGEK